MRIYNSFLVLLIRATLPRFRQRGVHHFRKIALHYDHPGEKPIQLVPNFEDDVKERLIEEGLEDAA